MCHWAMILSVQCPHTESTHRCCPRGPYWGINCFGAPYTALNHFNKHCTPNTGHSEWSVILQLAELATVPEQQTCSSELLRNVVAVDDACEDYGEVFPSSGVQVTSAALW